MPPLAGAFRPGIDDPFAEATSSSGGYEVVMGPNGPTLQQAWNPLGPAPATPPNSTYDFATGQWVPNDPAGGTGGVKPPPAAQPNPQVDPELAWKLSQMYATPAAGPTKAFTPPYTPPNLQSNASGGYTGSVGLGDQQSAPVSGGTPPPPPPYGVPGGGSGGLGGAGGSGGTSSGGGTGQIGDGTTAPLQGNGGNLNLQMPVFGNFPEPPTPTFAAVDPRMLQQRIASQQSTLGQQYGGANRQADQRLAAGGFSSTGPGATALHALLGSRQAGQNTDINRNETYAAQQYNSAGALPYAQAGLDQYNSKQQRGVAYNLGNKSAQAGLVGSLINAFS